MTSVLLIVAGTLFIFRSEMLSDNIVTSRDTTMTFTAFVMFDMFNALCCRSDSKSLRRLGLFTNKPLVYSILISILCQLMVIYVPFLQRIFQTEALGLWDLIKICLISSSVWVFDELRKHYQQNQAMYKRNYRRLPQLLNRINGNSGNDKELESV